MSISRTRTRASFAVAVKIVVAIVEKGWTMIASKESFKTVGSGMLSRMIIPFASLGHFIERHVKATGNAKVVT
jgi:hypothetical protein